jgi:hypothetical protein
MTSSKRLEALALAALHEAAEQARPLTVAEQHDLAYLRDLTPEQRLQLFNEVMLRAEAFGLPEPDLEPRRYHAMLL